LLVLQPKGYRAYERMIKRNPTIELAAYTRLGVREGEGACV
jgi:hypothetical protein